MTSTYFPDLAKWAKDFVDEDGFSLEGLQEDEIKIVEICHHYPLPQAYKELLIIGGRNIFYIFNSYSNVGNTYSNELMVRQKLFLKENLEQVGIYKGDEICMAGGDYQFYFFIKSHEGDNPPVYAICQGMLFRDYFAKSLTDMVDIFIKSYVLIIVLKLLDYRLWLTI
jgi:hypothetical protein